MRLTPLSAGIALILLMLGLAAHIVRDAREYRAFKQVEDTAGRQRYLRRWILSAALQFGLVSTTLPT